MIGVLRPPSSMRPVNGMRTPICIAWRRKLSKSPPSWKVAIASGRRCCRRVRMLVKSGVFCGWMSVETTSSPALGTTAALKASAPPRPKSESSATIATVLNGFLSAR